MSFSSYYQDTKITYWGVGGGGGGERGDGHEDQKACPTTAGKVLFVRASEG